MTYVNGTDGKRQIPLRGVLTLIAPDGERIPLMQVNDKPTELRKRASKTYTYRIPLSAHPRLAGLDLTLYDAVIVQPGQQ